MSNAYEEAVSNSYRNLIRENERLHATNAELLKELERISDWLESTLYQPDLVVTTEKVLERVALIRAAIAKAKGGE